MKKQVAFSQAVGVFFLAAKCQTIESQYNQRLPIYHQEVQRIFGG
jgi:hypothetical protein